MFYLVANSINFLLIKRTCVIRTILFFVLFWLKKEILLFS